MDINERRKHQRYNAPENSFAVLLSDNLIGPIDNLSLGGVSFTCIACSKQRYGKNTLEMFSKDRNFYLREIPFKVVSEVDLENQMPLISVQMKQISGEFIELSEYQSSQLEFFIQNFAAIDS